MGNPYTINCTSTSTDTYVGTRTSAAPIFQMSVTSSINATTATATAQVQPPPQLVGTVASVYVFAHARLSALKSMPLLDLAPAVLDGPAPDPCVLAQLNSSGQLVGASASTLTAATTGVLTSQAQSLTILNNVATPNVAGATFFVGYGTTSSAMLSGGIYEGAVSVPGSSACSGTLLAGASPTAPGAVSGLWWNAAESGWGIHYTQRGTNTFAAWYTYDASGNPKWYVSTCAGFSGVTGTCTGTLYEVTGPSFFGATFNPTLVSAANAGNLQVTFANANAASMTYTVGGQTRTIALTRQPLATGTIAPAVDYTDIWWNPAESGWGMAMAQQYGITFLAWYVYDSTGKPTWQVATCTMSGSSCSGTLYRTTGPAFGPAFDPNAVQATAAGTITVTFTDANNAVLSYTVGGVTATKNVTRQLF